MTCMICQYGIYLDLVTSIATKKPSTISDDLPMQSLDVPHAKTLRAALSGIALLSAAMLPAFAASASSLTEPVQNLAEAISGPSIPGNLMAVTDLQIQCVAYQATLSYSSVPHLRTMINIKT
jgi:type IV secretory pathway VirB2 component (pilin)